jgi:hypothetical protein
MPRLGVIELGIAAAYLKHADEATDREWERMWLDLAMTRLLCAEGDEAFNERVMTLYREVKERHANLSAELGYVIVPAPVRAEGDPLTLGDVMRARGIKIQEKEGWPRPIWTKS